ncbi:MAG TPA: GntP family permease [Bacteroidales bacterium]|nr:GntP family permease [Bacteroidales bacterium]
MSILLTSVLVAVSIILIILLTSKLKLQAFVALFIVSVFLAFTTLPPEKVVSTIKEGFGNTMASIGFLIILGAMIGITLDKTGATISIARFILSKTGESRSPQAIGITGFIAGIPIFCDSGFIITSGLARSFSARSKIAMPFMATVLATALYSVHCLIPPHPGALAAAGILNANIGYLILAGILFAIPGAIAAFYWSRWMTKGKNYPPAPEITITEHDPTDVEKDIRPVSTSIGQISDTIPTPFMSFLPIVVPLLLITVKSLLGLLDREGTGFLYRIFYFPGEPVFALAIGVILALLLLKNKSIASMNALFTEAVEKAGPILIITAAGGMFGMVIKSTGTGEALGKFLSGTSLGLAVPFIIAAIMKTAQGSSTVAIITTASFIAPMAGMLGLDSESGRLFGMLAMGAGSMIVSHANDSYFWVVSNFGGVDPTVNLKVYSTSTIVMGLTVFACVWLTSIFVM